MYPVTICIFVVLYITDLTQGSPVSNSGSLFSLLAIGHYMPSANQLKVRKLMRRLGNHYDPEWMSIDSPKLSNEVPALHAEDIDVLQKEISEEKVRWFEQFRNEFKSLKNETLQEIIRYLHRLSSCKINFEWQELGTLFWPKFVKTGSCASRGTCSWPPGMTCKSGSPKIIHVLRWHCKRRRKPQKQNRNTNRSDNDRRRGLVKKWKTVRLGDKKVKCSWKPIPYEVTTHCACGC